MRYLSERQELVPATEDLPRFNLLNPFGGALSVRAADGNLLVSTTQSHFRRWRVTEEDFIAVDPEGRIVDRLTEDLGTTALSLHAALYKKFPLAGAVIHTHAPACVAFSTLGIPLPSVTAQLDTLGEVGCVVTDDTRIKADQVARPDRYPNVIPEGATPRPDINAVVTEQITAVDKLIGHRTGELQRHGIAFLLYRHGVYVVARNLTEACENLGRVESAALATLAQAQLLGGLDKVKQHQAL